MLLVGHLFNTIHANRDSGGNTGKSSLTVQFVEKHFSDAYYPTIEYTYNRTLQLDRQTFSCEIVDTAGQDEFSILQSDYAVGVHGYMLVYSITSTATLELTRIIRDKILNLVGVDHVPMVLVGNKCDLNEKREVAAVDAAQLAKSWKAGWIETSAKTGDNIGNFLDCVDLTTVAE